VWILAIAMMAAATSTTLPLKLPDAEGIYVLDLAWHFGDGRLAIVANLTLGGEMPMYGLVASIIRLDNTTLGFNITAYAPVWHAAELHWPLAVLWSNVGNYVAVTELSWTEEYGLTHLHVAGTVDLAKASRVAQNAGVSDDSAHAIAELVSKQCKAAGHGAVRIIIGSAGGNATVNASGTWRSSGDVGCTKELYAKVLPALTALIKYAVSDILPPPVADLADSVVQASATLPGSASFRAFATIEDVPGGIIVSLREFVLYEESGASSARPAEDYAWLYTAAALAAGMAAAITYVYLRRR